MGISSSGIMSYPIYLYKTKSMAIKKVWIEPGCIGAKYCNKIIPEVFGLDDSGDAFIEEGAEFSKKNEKKIKKAARICPVRVIQYEEE